MITYKAGKPGITKVLLEGKIVGEIRAIERGKYFQYFPKGGGTGGQIFSNIQAVKNSLEFGD